MVDEPPHGLLCLGALNEDVVIFGTVPVEDLGAVASALTPFTPYGEMAVSDAVSEELLAVVRGNSLESQSQLGGSAFNVMRSLIPMCLGLRLGFVGVAGEVSGRHPHVDFLASQGVETSAVARSSTSPARSIAFAADGDRTLFTSPGANREAGRLFTSELDSLAAYIASFEMVHVTSFLDRDTPASLHQLLRAAFDLNPSLTVSLDPGHMWCTDVTKDIEGLIGLTSILHLNALEFSLLGGRVGNEPDEQLAHRVREMMWASGRRLLVIRRHDSAAAYANAPAGGVIAIHVPNERLLPSQAVQDATGAGDSFTAGLLAMLISPAFQLLAGARVGTAIARANVQSRGPLDPDQIRIAATSALGLSPAAIVSPAWTDARVPGAEGPV